MKATSIDDVITAVVAALSAAVSYPVFDGPPSTKPGRGIDRWVAIGADDVDNQDNPTDSARMEATIAGLGMIAREEHAEIYCVATGKAVDGSIAQARAIATAVVQDVSDHLALRPTDDTYGAHISSVSGVRSQNRTGGAVVEMPFSISTIARLT